MPPFSTALSIYRIVFPQLALWAKNISPFSTAEIDFIVKIPFINLEFFFKGNTVGIFKKFKYPTKDGECKYEPFRGLGHYEMWKFIKEKGVAICFYINGDEKVFFKVEDSGKYGKLILSEFRKEIIQN